MQVRCEPLEQPGRQLHDLGGGAVVDGELVAGHRIFGDFERHEDANPRRGRAGADCLRLVACQRERLRGASPGDGAPLHRRKILGLVDHHVAVPRVGRAHCGHVAGDELVGELLVHAVQLVGGRVTHESCRGEPDFALAALQPVAARRLTGQVLQWAPAPRAVRQPLLQNSLRHVIERRPPRAGALRARRDGPEEEVGLVEEGHVGLAPSVTCLFSGVQRVQLLRREDVASGIREASGRREKPAHEHFGSEQRPDGMERLCERVSVDHLDERSRVADCFRSDAADSVVAFEGVAVRVVERAPTEAARPTAGQRCASSTVAWLSSRWRPVGRGRRRGATARPTARCPPTVRAREPGPLERGRRPCEGRP